MKHPNSHTGHSNDTLAHVTTPQNETEKEVLVGLILELESDLEKAFMNYHKYNVQHKNLTGSSPDQRRLVLIMVPLIAQYKRLLEALYIVDPGLNGTSFQKWFDKLLYLYRNHGDLMPPWQGFERYCGKTETPQDEDTDEDVHSPKAELDPTEQLLEKLALLEIELDSKWKHFSTVYESLRHENFLRQKVKTLRHRVRVLIQKVKGGLFHQQEMTDSIKLLASGSYDLLAQEKEQTLKELAELVQQYLIVISELKKITGDETAGEAVAKSLAIFGSRIEYIYEVCPQYKPATEQKNVQRISTERIPTEQERKIIDWYISKTNMPAYFAEACVNATNDPSDHVHLVQMWNIYMGNPRVPNIEDLQRTMYRAGTLAQARRVGEAIQAIQELLAQIKYESSEQGLHEKIDRLRLTEEQRQKMKALITTYDQSVANALDISPDVTAPPKWIIARALRNLGDRDLENIANNMAQPGLIVLPKNISLQEIVDAMDLDANRYYQGQRKAEIFDIPIPLNASMTHTIISVVDYGIKQDDRYEVGFGCPGNISDFIANREKILQRLGLRNLTVAEALVAMQLGLRLYALGDHGTNLSDFTRIHIMPTYVQIPNHVISKGTCTIIGCKQPDNTINIVHTLFSDNTQSITVAGQGDGKCLRFAAGDLNPHTRPAYTLMATTNIKK